MAVGVLLAAEVAEGEVAAPARITFAYNMTTHMTTLFHIIATHWLMINALGIPALIGLMFVARSFGRRNMSDALYERRALPSEYDPPKNFRPAYLLFVPGGMNFGHTMGATVIDLVLRGVILASTEGGSIVMTKTNSDNAGLIAPFEKDILNGLFHDREEFRFPGDVSDAFDSAFNANFYEHVKDEYYREALGPGGVAALQKEQMKFVVYAGLLVVIGFIVWFVLFLLGPVSFVAAIALPYVGYQLIAVRLKSTSEYYRDYLDLTAKMSGYQSFLSSVAYDKEDVARVDKWNKHTPFLVALGLGADLSDKFYKIAFTPAKSA